MKINRDYHTLDPVIFNIGRLALCWYSLILLLAIGIGIGLTAGEAERKGIKKEDMCAAAVWIIVAGIIGACLLHVLAHWSHEYAANPIHVFYIWEGGLAIWGAMTGGLIAATLLAWRHGGRFPKLLDTATLGLVLAQAIGRIACVITGDVIGKPTSICIYQLHPRACL